MATLDPPDWESWGSEFDAEVHELARQVGRPRCPKCRIELNVYMRGALWCGRCGYTEPGDGGRSAE